MADEAPLWLASIVGVDVAGYSARTEADSSATARQIVAMRTRIADVAARHHGRIFNTAGDGVMMEFTAASDAVEAIFDLLDERPAREPEAHIGAHLGDVTTTDNGDLLGHGVNVAARLMALAPAGRAVISQDLRAAAGSHAAGRQMRALGEVSLAKMQAKVHAFEIAPDTGAKIAADAAWRKHRTPVIAAGAAILVLGIAVVAFFLLRPEPAGPDETPGAARDQPQTLGSAAAEAPDVSIAVLPFVNMSSDPEQEYFSDGLSEELMNQLANVEGLRVTARTSSFAFKGKNEDLRVIGEKLGVANVLEGSVRKSGERLRITAQLIRVTDGSHLWSETYDRNLDDVFAIQDSIAMTVAVQLSKELGIGVRSLDYGGTKSVEAYDLYLKARNEPWASGSTRPIEYLRRAVAIDPDYALGWVALASAFAEAQGDIEPAERGPYEVQHAAALDRALALAPDLPAALNESAYGKAMKLDWFAAEEALLKARANAASNDPEMTAGFGWYYLTTGRLQESLPFFERSRDLDPVPLSTSVGLLRVYSMLEKWEGFDAEYRRSQGLNGDKEVVEFLQLMHLIGSHADKAAIDSQFQRALNRDAPHATLQAISTVYASPEKALAALHELHNAEPNGMNTRLAMFAGSYGDTDLAMSELRNVVAYAHPNAFQQFWNPQLSEARKDPRFKEMMREVGFADFWLKTGKWPDFCGPVGADDFKCW